MFCICCCCRILATLKNNPPFLFFPTLHIHEQLGEGAFAVVKRATDKQTNESVAIKIVNRSSLNRDIESALKDEIMILNELCHDHIMRLDDVVVTINHYYLVAEYLEGGELFDRIVEKSSVSSSIDVCLCALLTVCRIFISCGHSNLSHHIYCLDS